MADHISCRIQAIWYLRAAFDLVKESYGRILQEVGQE
jgi:hypothetical protein